MTATMRTLAFLSLFSSCAYGVPFTYTFQLNDYRNDSSYETGAGNEILNWYQSDFGSKGMTVQITVDDGADYVKAGYNVSHVREVTVTSNGSNSSGEYFSQTWTESDRTDISVNGTYIFQVGADGVASLDYTGNFYGNPERQEVVFKHLDDYDEATRSGYRDFFRLGLTPGRYIFGAGEGQFIPFVSVASYEPDQIIESLAGYARGDRLTTSPLSGSIDDAPDLESTEWSAVPGSPEASAQITTLEDGNSVIEGTTGSPISIETELAVPASGLMEITFDYQFVTGGGWLDILLENTLGDLVEIGSIAANGIMNDLASFTISGINLSDYGASPLLRFTFDDIQSGSVVYLDNIQATFGGDSSVIEEFENSRLATVPNPASLVLMGLGLVVLGCARRRFEVSKNPSQYEN